MDYFLISPTGAPLSGEVEISGAKNAVLATMTAAMLADGTTTLTNVPYLRDTKTMSNVLRVIGCRIDGGAHEFKVDSHGANHLEAPYELVSTMRASFYVLGPLVARFGRCRVSLPGGCAWGPRPVDLHLKGLEALGAKIEVTHGYVEATSDGPLPGGNFRFPIVSVGATVNVLMAATLAKGTSVLENAAIEPEIDSLIDLLECMGAKIEGIGTRSLVVHGVPELHPGFSKTIPDRIEAGSFLCGGVISRGKIKATHCNPTHIKSLLDIFEEMGCTVNIGADWVEVDASRRDLKPVHVEAVPYPGFPTDLQAPLMAVLATVPGESKIRDSVYLDRFKHVAELNRLGANISLEGNVATIKGVEKLQGAPVMASDLRAAAALVITGLVADGETRVSRIYHLDRGYEDFERKIAQLGGKVSRLNDQIPAE